MDKYGADTRLRKPDEIYTDTSLENENVRFFTKEQVTKLEAGFDNQGLSVHQWHKASPPEPEFLCFDKLANSWALAEHLQKATSVKPSKNWITQSKKLVKEAGASTVRKQLTKWLLLLIDDALEPGKLVDYKNLWHIGYQKDILSRCKAAGIMPADIAQLAFAHIYGRLITPVESDLPYWRMFDGSGSHPWVVSKTNATLVRGIIWLLSHTAVKADVALLEKLTVASLTKYNSRDEKKYCSLTIANACIYALGQLADSEAVMALGRINRKTAMAGSANRSRVRCLQPHRLPACQLPSWKKSRFLTLV